MCSSNFINGTCDARSSLNGAYGFGEVCNVTFAQPVTLNVRPLPPLLARDTPFRPLYCTALTTTLQTY